MNKMKDVKISHAELRHPGGNASKNSLFCRITLPSKWVKQLNISKEDNQIKMTCYEDKIVIEKCSSSGLSNELDETGKEE